MFALLEHATDRATPAGPTATDVHWDFLLDVAGTGRLPTWSLAQNPLGHTGPIPAARLPDHRRQYVEYEGAISGGRGSVRRLDRGAATVLCNDGAALRFVLRGERLIGCFEIVAAGEAGLVFRACETTQGGSGIPPDSP
jgi:hypothetical protein